MMKMINSKNFIATPYSIDPVSQFARHAVSVGGMRMNLDSIDMSIT